MYMTDKAGHRPRYVQSSDGDTVLVEAKAGELFTASAAEPSCDIFLLDLIGSLLPSCSPYNSLDFQ